MTTTTPEDESPLSPEQHARAKALRVAREVTGRRNGLAGVEPTATVNDLVDLARYILDGTLPWAGLYEDPDDREDDDA